MAADTLSTLRSKAGDNPQRFSKREARLAKVVSDGLGGIPAGAVVAAELVTTAGGAATETVAVSGVLPTDVVLAILQSVGATPRTITRAIAGTDEVDIVFSGNPSTDHVVNLVVLRPL